MPVHGRLCDWMRRVRLVPSRQCMDSGGDWRSAAVLAVCLLKTRRQGVRLTLLGFAISLVFCAGYRAVLLRPIEAFCAQNQAELHAEVLDYPTASRYGSAVLVKVKTGGAGMKAVLYYQQDAALSPGDQIFCTAKLRAASPDNLERDEYYASRGVWAVLSVKGQLTVTPGTWSLRHLPALGGKAAQGRVPGGFPGGRFGLFDRASDGRQAGAVLFS